MAITQGTRRRERSVRLNDREWLLAEAIGRMGGERSSAGLGVREALRLAEQLIIADSGELLIETMEEIRQERKAHADALSEIRAKSLAGGQ